MKTARLIGVMMLLSGVGTAVAADAPKVVRLATLEWMPFSGTTLPNDGVASATVAEVVKHMGRGVKFDYFDWKDAVATGGSDPGFSGYFPAYHTEERAQKLCHLSGPIGSSTSGIAYLKDKPVPWKTVGDLASMKIGVVEGYSNGEQFDAAVAKGAQPVDVSSTDTVSIKKLMSKKVPAIVIEKSVLQYMTRKSAARDSIVFDDKPLLQQNLHVCFQRTPVGKATQEAFDAALKKVDTAKFANAYFKALDAGGK